MADIQLFRELLCSIVVVIDRDLSLISSFRKLMQGYVMHLLMVSIETLSNFYRSILHLSLSICRMVNLYVSHIYQWVSLN